MPSDVHASYSRATESDEYAREGRSRMNFTAAVVAMAETAAAAVTGLDDAFVTAWDSTDVMSPMDNVDDEEEVDASFWVTASRNPTGANATTMVVVSTTSAARTIAVVILIWLGNTQDFVHRVICPRQQIPANSYLECWRS